jgi:protein-S-isoprenylcysteine O-methyltransferase Ste14
MKIDKRWILWIVYFILELTLLRLAIMRDVPDELPPLQEWRRQALFAAVASLGAVLLGLITWRMRWSMRPRLLRVIMVILIGVGAAVTVLEWIRVFKTTQLIAEDRAREAAKQKSEPSAKGAAQ